MTRTRLLLLLLAFPFLLADSCVRQVFVLYEYELDHCPAPGFELPQHVEFAGWELMAGESEPYCHGFTRYDLDELKEAGAFSEPIRGAWVYARLIWGKTCQLQLISSLACNPRESIEECEARMPYHGKLPALRATVNDYTDVVAERLLLGQKFSARLPAARATNIGRVDALEAWCEKR